ncbi:transglycosylase SLT domain-containing protein [Actinacidiphila paucisporea]|uniref:Transglycosylase SLT domain-containing protein n=1 Tax=Actinacidiphila paucisporea TaxID=310782 RepID=A0A1M7DB00_9ACTN|nr:transglycosylase SLT domain-containing protein [Actinacidiphila paucisporea]SHL76598.1 Transglycosylase SLT domain-containing protein [Actinacidiphila paucisporea]
MQLPTIPKIGRLSKKHKITAAGAAAAAAVVLAVTGLQATGGSAEAKGEPTGFSVESGQQVKSLDAQAGLASQKAIQEDAAAKKKAAADTAAQQKASADTAARQKAAADAAAKKKAADTAAAKKKAEQAAAKKRAAARAAARAKAEQAATRSTHRTTLKVVVPKLAPKKAVTAVPVAAVVYPDNLDGWIREARAVLAAHNIPVPTYNGIYRNIMRESSGNPNAINLWDINAQNGIPSKGLLQTIDPTFNAYHVSGTSWNVYNPVANIAAACNYAWHVYGGMDNVNSAY